MTADRSWKVTVERRPSLKDTTFIEGLPGIGNVGKVVVDYLIEQVGAERIARFFSNTLPNSVFVNEDSLVELPKIEVYHARIKGKDFLFMTGDVQPADEVASYTFCQEVLSRAGSWGVRRVITLGGIGLQEEPSQPDVYCTGNDEGFVATFASLGANKDVYGTVGPIIGVSGLLLGLADPRTMPAAALLAETLGHPMYLGLKGAKSILGLLDERFGFGISFDGLDEEIAQLDDESPDQKSNPKLDSINRLKRYKDMNYIG
ncbi:PAC2 family protein [Candidatus Woesearchaeota archaeon]|nr:PAC2 family protein [Candidatus Woesearchaeota archaeon]